MSPRAFLAACLLISASFAHADPFTVEGPIGAVERNTSDPDLRGYLTVMGVRVRLEWATTIRTPTGTLGVAALAAGKPFPAREAPGFIGATAVVVGDTLDRGIVATDVLVLVQENVLVGPASPAPFRILGTPVVALDDARIPYAGARNAFGFEVDLASVPAGDASTAEGYFGSDGALHAHRIETTGGDVLDATPRASVQRIVCNADVGAGRDRLRVQGGVVLGASREVTLCQGNAEQCFGQRFTVAVTPDTADPRFGSYLLDRSNLDLAACRQYVWATYEGVTTLERAP